MLRLLLPVDGSQSALRATRTLIESIAWYKEPPAIDVLTVHLPVPRFANMGLVVSNDMIERYYDEECAEMLAPSKAALAAAGVNFTAHRRVGSIAESIIEQAKHSASNMMYMGTRGRTALANMVLGTVATKVLHLAHIPVVLVH